MNGDLSHWGRRLGDHFRELASIRGNAGGRPLFALEHNLKLPEIEALRASIHKHIAQNPPFEEHALAWIVYAAELGYEYSGDEYWQTFEEQTPGWTVHGDRYWIRNCFRMFQNKFRGARPSGAWAEHFSIICWPITHAILPQDLQRQLARILYEIRHSFSADLFESPHKLGEYIAARSWNGTSRFQNFAQETDLVGQISAALLLQGQLVTDSLIHPATLKRISADLDRERRAREWLSGARRFAQERMKISGQALGHRTGSVSARRPEEARTEVAALGIEPSLVLRPNATDASRWEVFLKIPDLSHLLLRFPNTRDILMGSRCLVAGMSGRPLARGRCLHGAQSIKLSLWPSNDEVLLQFEQKDALLEYLLRTECLLRPGPIWLFKIASDGLAYESRSLRVRPGHHYIIITTAGPISSNNYVQPIDLECKGVHAAILELPTALTEDWDEALRRLGLVQAKTIEVWPAGLGAVVWDGEGHGEWLASERPCLAIQTDHPISSLLVSMEAMPSISLELKSLTPGEPIFVQLPQLPVGLHTIRLSTRITSSAEVEPLGDLDVVMRIREARPWSPGISPNGPLVVLIDPPSPTIEELWEGRVEISLLGPTGRKVKCSVSLGENEAREITLIKDLPPITLPVTPDFWRLHFEKYFKETREAQLAYDTARLCDIKFTCDELGAFSVRCEREFTPLRWAVHRNGKSHVARLLDDSGYDTPPQVLRMAFEAPLTEQPLKPATTYEVPTEGGLYVARQGRYSAAVIIPPSVRALVDLQCDPFIDARERSTNSVLRLVSAARTWGSARLPGDLFSMIFQRDVLRTLALHIFRLIGGETWATAEIFAENNPSKRTNLKQEISKRREEASIGFELVSACPALSATTCDKRVQHMASLATKFHVVSPGPRREIIISRSVVRRVRPTGAKNPMWLSELALRLASAPAEVEEWAGEDLRTGVARLFEVPSLARAARFLVITTHWHLDSRVAPGEIYASWSWK
ncbi:MAG: hypothetical protein C4575_05785 [Desulforudis sp.]|nr:MAG: hypothetical protein C4575_05785 [Desulforudis sp.]